MRSLSLSSECRPTRRDLSAIELGNSLKWRKIAINHSNHHNECNRLINWLPMLNNQHPSA
jgi:hypothetical protein